MKYYFLYQISVLSCGILLSSCASFDQGGRQSGVVAASVGKVRLPAGVALKNPLSEDQAVWIALFNNAAFLEAMADVGLAEADLVQAKTLPNPTLSMLFPAGPKQLEFAVKYPAEAIWLRPKRVAVARLDADKIAKTLQQSSMDLVRDVRIAYTNLSLAKERVKLAGEALRLSGEVAELVDARRRAGTALELEATTAKTDQLQAKQELEKLGDDVTLAKNRLAKVLGIGLSDFNISPSGLSEVSSVPADLAGLLQDAFAARADLRAAEIAIESAVARAGLANSEAYKLTAVLDTNGSGSDFEAGPGIDLPIPLFDRNQAGKARAKAIIEKASKHYLAVRDQIILEVRESHTLALQAQRSADTWKHDIIPPLEGAIDQAERAYKGGSATFLQVVETNRKLTAARLRYSEARADLQRASTELERAVGHYRNAH
ncbi:MAG: TolC family protein [Verrucomicrobiales bacterium]